VEFHARIKFVKLVHLVGFVIKKSRNTVCFRYIIVNTRHKDDNKDDDDDDNNNNDNNNNNNNNNNSNTML
jgi:hypothetical protein